MTSCAFALLQAYSEADEAMAAQLLGRELALVLGLDFTTEWDMLPLFAIRGQMMAVANSWIRSPNWTASVTRELSRPPRLSSYPDSILH